MNPPGSMVLYEFCYRPTLAEAFGRTINEKSLPRNFEGWRTILENLETNLGFASLDGRFLIKSTYNNTNISLSLIPLKPTGMNVRRQNPRCPD